MEIPYKTVCYNMIYIYIFLYIYIYIYITWEVRDLDQVMNCHTPYLTFTIECLLGVFLRNVIVLLRRLTFVISTQRHYTPRSTQKYQVSGPNWSAWIPLGCYCFDMDIKYIIPVHEYRYSMNNNCTASNFVNNDFVNEIFYIFIPGYGYICTCKTLTGG